MESISKESISLVQKESPKEISENSKSSAKTLNNIEIIDPKEEEIALLISKGYKEELVRKIYCFLKPKTLNKAIEYMTYNYNKQYKHDFYQSLILIDNCFLCGLPKNKHQNYEPPIDVGNLPLIALGIYKLVEFLLELGGHTIALEPPTSIVRPESDVKCNICMSGIDKSEINEFVLPCNHQCCKECFFQYIKEHINEGKISDIHCFSYKCNTIISESTIQSTIKDDKDLIDKYEKIKKRNLILSDEDKKFCPEPKCDSFLECKKGQDKYVKCENGHQYCYVCLQKWHYSEKCSDEIDKSFQLYSMNTVLKRCPFCRYYTERDWCGNHIKCPICDAHWCWLCHKIMYYSKHYDGGGTCAAQEFSKKHEPDPKIAEQNSYSGPYYFNELD